MNGFYVGDIIGNSYTHENENYNKKTKDFVLFTERSKFSDDTILSFATIKWLMGNEHTSKEMLNIIKKFYEKYPDKEPTLYGPAFAEWAKDGCKEYRTSSGNGGAMRSGVIGYVGKTLAEVKELVYYSITPTHNTFYGIQGAEVVAVSVFLLRHGKTLNELKDYIAFNYGYNLEENIDDYRNKYTYTSNAKETIRPALISLLNSVSYEDAIRNAVSFGGDTDTITTITSMIAEAYYKTIPSDIVQKAKTYLTPDFIEFLEQFNKFIN
jgi:ADP-ribosylglycohydrolase